MHVINLTHYLDVPEGAIDPYRGLVRNLAEFMTAVVAHASNFDRLDDTPGPLCFKCRKRDRPPVDTAITEDDLVVWRCVACGTDGQVADWQGSF